MWNFKLHSTKISLESVFQLFCFSHFSIDIKVSQIQLVNKLFSPFLGLSNNTDKLPPDEVYPVMAKSSPSLQIIATRNRPCCECIRYNQRAQPLCLLFLIFIVVSCSLITGVMFYLKAGNQILKYLNLISINLQRLLRSRL